MASSSRSRPPTNLSEEEMALREEKIKLFDQSGFRKCIRPVLTNIIERFKVECFNDKSLSVQQTKSLVDYITSALKDSDSYTKVDGDSDSYTKVDGDSDSYTKVDDDSDSYPKVDDLLQGFITKKIQHEELIAKLSSLAEHGDNFEKHSFATSAKRREIYTNQYAWKTVSKSFLKELKKYGPYDNLHARLRILDTKLALVWGDKSDDILRSYSNYDSSGLLADNFVKFHYDRAKLEFQYLYKLIAHLYSISAFDSAEEKLTETSSFFVFVETYPENSLETIFQVAHKNLTALLSDENFLSTSDLKSTLTEKERKSGSPKELEKKELNALKERIAKIEAAKEKIRAVAKAIEEDRKKYLSQLQKIPKPKKPTVDTLPPRYSVMRNLGAGDSKEPSNTAGSAATPRRHTAGGRGKS